MAKSAPPNCATVTVALLMLGAMLSLAVILPLTIPSVEPGGVPLEDDYGVELHANYSYLESVCSCYSGPPDWGTTERAVSNAHFAHPGPPVPDPRGLSTWAWAWGQFIDHDIVQTLTSPAAEDVFQIPFNGEITLTLKRVIARTFEENTCREAHTQRSPAIDGSTVYGDYWNVTAARALRTNGGYGCEISLPGGFLPVVNGSLVCGDDRCGEHAVLSTLHTVFAREHNRWCSVLHVANATRTPDERFYEARALVIATIQRITYEEWLPALFGSQASLLSPASPLPKIGTGMRLTTAFAGAAYRFGHSMVGDTLGQWGLAELFFDPTFLPTHSIEAVATAAATTPAERVDALVVDGLRNALFGMFGEDLVTRNLFRARELRVASYGALAQCFGFEAQPAGSLTRDPLLALLQDPLVPGSSLPRGVAVIVAEQFRRLRDYDPAFYTRRARYLHPTFYATAAKSTLGSVLKRVLPALDAKYTQEVFFTK